MIIGEKITNQRNVLNLTVEQLAQKLNVSLKTVEMWEDGTIFPTVAMLKRISSVLKIPSQELCGLSDPDEAEKEEELDTKMMNKYKNICLIATIFVLLAFVLILMTQLYEPIASHNVNVVFTVETLIIIVNTLLITVSVGFMVWNLMQFISYYSLKYYKRKFRIHMWEYLSIYLIVSVIISVSSIVLIVV